MAEHLELSAAQLHLEPRHLTVGLHLLLVSRKSQRERLMPRLGPQESRVEPEAEKWTEQILFITALLTPQEITAMDHPERTRLFSQDLAEDPQLDLMVVLVQTEISIRSKPTEEQEELVQRRPLLDPTEQFQAKAEAADMAAEAAVAADVRLCPTE